jgi:UDP-N-acetylglucosamine 2-epimerase (non-hydrolysing)
MKTVVVVYGTRPEAIKLAPVIVELKKLHNLRIFVVCSGQHKEMLEGIMELWNLAPDLTLEFDFDSGRSSAIPSLMMELEKSFSVLTPDCVLVHGDTATATAASLQAHADHIAVAHVEAGLRSGDLWNPWPEESNRKIIDALSSLHFAPTAIAKINLEKEGFTGSIVTGNTIVDSIRHVSNLLENLPEIIIELESEIGFTLENEYILFTHHRRESFGSGLENIFQAIIRISELGIKIVYPMHLNPAVREYALKFLNNRKNIYLVSPQEYLPFLQLLKSCKLVISDSGGIQEEAVSFQKPILITRLVTERPEVILSGFGKIVGYDENTIVNEAIHLIKNVSKSTLETNPFGNGFSAKIIAEHVNSFLVN